MIATFIIPGEPVPKGRPRFTRTGHAYTPRKTIDHENLVKGVFKNSCPLWEITDKNLYIEMTFIMQLPASMSEKRKKELDGQYCDKNRDYDNLAKLLTDSLNGIAFKDDRQIVHAVQRKIWGREGLTKVYMEEL